MSAGVADRRARTSSALGSRPVHRTPSRRQVIRVTSGRPTPDEELQRIHFGVDGDLEDSVS